MRETQKRSRFSSIWGILILRYPRMSKWWLLWYIPRIPLSGPKQSFPHFWKCGWLRALSWVLLYICPLLTESPGPRSHCLPRQPTSTTDQRGDTKARHPSSRQDHIPELILGLIVAFVLTIRFFQLPNSTSSPSPLMLTPRALPNKPPACRAPPQILFSGNQL